MRYLRRSCSVKSVIISSSILLFFSVLFTDTGIAAFPADLKAFLLKMNSSISYQDIGHLQTGYAKIQSQPEDAGPQSFAPAASPVQSYFPLDSNDVKYYQGVVLGSTYNANYSYDNVFFNGRWCYRESDSLDGSQVYYGYSGDQLQMYGATVESDSLAFDAPLNILNDSILNNDGSLQSGTTLTWQGYFVTVSVTVTSSLVGSVNVPLGQVDNCRSIEMTTSYSIPDESETLELKEVWILAPNIGKLKIAVMDQFLNPRGWLNLTGGTVSGKSISEIITPTPLVAEFDASPLYGVAPLTVSFTDRSTGSVNTWAWDFGEGQSSSDKNPIHVYSMPGIYTVSLTASSTSASDTEIKPAYIRVAHAGADLNNDYKVDINDAILALRITANFPQVSSIFLDLDVNGDNRFGLEDVLYILQSISGVR